MTHLNPKRNIVPRAVLISKSLVPLTTARPVNTVQPRPIMNSATPMSNPFNKEHSSVRRPFNKLTAKKNNNLYHRVNTVKGSGVNTARPKAVFKVVKGNLVNAVKASACWIWRPKQKVLDHVSKHNSASISCKEFNYGNLEQDLLEKSVFDNGCSRHMTRNKSYLTNFEEIDGGFVAIGGKSKGGKITGKGTKASNDAGKTRVETVPGKYYILLPLWTANSLFSSPPKSSPNDGFKPSGDAEKEDTEDPRNDNDKTITKDTQRDDQVKDADTKNTNSIHTVSTPVNGASSTFISVDSSTWINVVEYPNDPNMLDLENIASSENEVVFGAEANMTNLDTYIPVSPIPTTKLHKDHLVEQIIGDIHSAPQTRRMKKETQDANPNIKRSKLDRSYARGASVVH
ncbi:hypothetical protein Tco_1496215, partial [Tanacetum coccineum]